MSIQNKNIQSFLNLSIEYYFYLIISLIPVGGKILSYSLIPFFILVIFFVLTSKRTFHINYGGGLLVLFFLLHLLSLFYTENISSGLYEVEKTLSFLLVPLSLSLIVDKIQLIRRKIFYAYLFSIVLVSLFNLSRAILSYIEFNDISVFYYSEFSYFLHATYYAMYISFSFPVIYELAGSATWKWKFIYTGIAIFLFGIVYLLSSKAGLFVSALIIFYLLVRIRNKWTRIFSGILLVAMIFIVFSNARFKTLRFFVTHPDYYLNKETQESSSVRIITWKSSLELIGENMLTGVGVGDVRDSLLDKYKNKGFMGAYNKSLNSHNQFLETGVGIGIPGILLLVAILIFPFVKKGGNKNFVLVSFILIVTVNLLFESMLKTQAGVIFIVIMYCILIYLKKEPENENTNRDRG